MISITEDKLSQAISAIVREFNPERIILFGSRARGDIRPDSDIDLLIITDKPFNSARSRWKEIERLWSVMIRYRIPADILLYNKDEIEHWHDCKSHIISRILQEGKVLYERS